MPAPGATPGRPVGTITRGTTNPNRLRRIDRWLTGPAAWRWRGAATPAVVDLGFGASPVTTVELFLRLRRAHPRVRVIGVEIDPARVAAARDHRRPGLEFVVGGFDLPVPGAVDVVRAANVLRQYPLAEVAGHWANVQARLAGDGVLIDATCDEIGRRMAWIAIDRHGPVSLTLSWRLRDLGMPSQVAERLPKVLIHRNVPGEPVHAALSVLDEAWRRAAPQGAFGARQRFVAMAEEARRAGLPVAFEPARWRLGELTLPWSAVAPADEAPPSQE